MKKTIGIFIVGIGVAFSGLAQTNNLQPIPSTPPETPATPVAAVEVPGILGKEVTKLGGDFFAWFKDNKAFFTNKVVIVEAGALYHRDLGVGGFADVQFPITDQLSAGFAVAYLDGQFYDAALSIKAGTTINIPWIKLPVYAYVETGPGYNLSKGEVIAQSFAGAIVKFDISSKWVVTVGGAVGNISDVSGAVLAGGASLSYKF